MQANDRGCGAGTEEIEVHVSFEKLHVGWFPAVAPKRRR
jgi:hypothetical protein